MAIFNNFALKLKCIIWPILPHETKRILTLSTLLFLVCFNYSTLRCMKDTVVVTASSAAVIPFIKVWVLLPMAVLFTFLYMKISNRLSAQKVFYVIVSAFLAFFLMFAFFLYPNREQLHLVGLADFLRSVLPTGFSGFIAMVEYWSFTIFYTIAELWSNIVLSILTWGFINEITSLKDAPRFYTVFSVASNAAAIAAGLCANIFVSGSFKGDWQSSQQWMIASITVSGAIVMFLYHIINKQDIKPESGPAKLKKQKTKFSLSDSFKEIKKSKHLTYLVIIVVAYFFVINTVEVIWKEQLRIAYPSPSEFNHYMNTLTALIGAVSTVLGLLVGMFIKRFGWTKTAISTPIIMLVTSLLFFIFVVFKDNLSGVCTLLGTTPLAVAVFLGAAQNCLSKGAKYSIFDATKEMAFIPLPKETKIKGKAAIDGIMSRLGKSGASLSLQGLILMFGGLVASTPVITIIMLSMIVAWAYSTFALGEIIDKAIDQNKDQGTDKKEAHVVSSEENRTLATT